MNDFKESMINFNIFDGDNFSGCFTEGNFGHYYLETRARKKDGRLCIIMYYGYNKGYEIFAQEI